MLSSDWNSEFIIERIDLEPKGFTKRLIAHIIDKSNVQHQQQEQ
jgi:hypothetical protein